MKKMLFILTIGLFCSCKQEQPGYVEGASGNFGGYEVIYFKDERTGFCFAERGYSDSYTFTCVPCTEEVENLIKYSK